ncbi:MAG: peptide chain release factor N(5)-glutamine methyltransferase [Deltaproteobacteria bacterium]|nr:peptide chain release factor N(5)-glutamine methyltransferase [Deltaproteobacteria bacterium]MBW2019700.1 peptide chain release factor N(5)-glutamine methyltransferase [Deltaproteobacteria bacterium]MBW2074533.1 peptide chain release factor N(5)-glutamine methyltransferase [Deltaproteobacteria bacterium]RLB81809.1 MAG: peptide chain release factor N(5)-glutamine methyltransferase [Deltaproteobacteria bacterium]
MLPETWTILKLLQWTTAHFKSHHIEQPRADAEILLAHTLGIGRIDLYVQYDRPLESHELEVFKGFIQRRIQREPVAYIVEKKEFWSMELSVTRDVLIPRPETEILVEAAITIIPPEPGTAPLRILDLGTGSGAIVLAMASERPGHSFYAVERSEKALAVAQNNARIHELDRAIRFLQGNWFDPVRNRGRYFSLIVSNPPYISHHEFKALPPEITRYEPREALDGGPDGLESIRLIIEKASEHLVPGGWLFFEIGYNQWAAVEKLIAGSKAYSDWAVIKDYRGHDRVVQARANGQSSRN